jgi:cytochrome P450 family 97 subfamily B polypeptide 3
MKIFIDLSIFVVIGLANGLLQSFPSLKHRPTYYNRNIAMTATEAPNSIEKRQLKISKSLTDDSGDYDGSGWVSEERETWAGYQEGFDWQLERARRLLEGPSFAPIRMTLWRPMGETTSNPPGLIDNVKILLNNALSMLGLAASFDGAPVVQGVNTFKGDPLQLVSRFIDGDLAELAGGPLFLLLNQYYKEYGPIYKLAFGPKSFMVVSDPVIAKHILKESPLKYDKGILAEILYPIMGKGLIPADPATWKVRRRAIVPGFHKAWLNAMMKLFVKCNEPLVSKLQHSVDTKTPLNMETEFCSVSLDIIGKAVFNYEFGSVTKESPIVKAVYRTLQEAEHRSTSFIPYWDIPFAKYFIKNLREFEDNMKMLNKVLDELILNAVDTKDEADVSELEARDYSSMENPSLLRFLVDMRGEDTTSRQLRDDLMTMLIAGHETTAAVLTWTFFNLAQQPELMKRVRNEIDEVLQGREPTYEDMTKLTLVRLCLAETLRLYPEPPILIRRALEDDVLPMGGAGRETFIPRGTDVFIATWNIHRSDQFWEKPEEYNPDRFMTSFQNPSQPQWAGQKPCNTNAQLYPNEVITDFAFLPFGGGSRKCVGDQFAMMEAVATVVMILQRFDLSLATSAEEVGMKTGKIAH